jgi:hypothetical protein
MPFDPRILGVSPGYLIGPEMFQVNSDETLCERQGVPPRSIDQNLLVHLQHGGAWFMSVFSRKSPQTL